MRMTADQQLTASLQRFGLERDRLRAAVARGAGITATALDALEHLEADGPLTQRQIGERLSLTSGAVTQLVDRLETSGWVFRAAHPSDRRYVVVTLAPEAAERTPAGLVAYHAQIRQIAAQVPLEHREAVINFLQAAAIAAASATSTTP